MIKIVTSRGDVWLNPADVRAVKGNGRGGSLIDLRGAPDIETDEPVDSVVARVTYTTAAGPRADGEPVPAPPRPLS